MTSRSSALVFLLLAACGGPVSAPDETAKSSVTADPAPVADEIRDYSVELAVGHRMDLSGNVEEQERFSWQDTSGKTHTVEAPAELKPLAEGVCIYLLAGADGKPMIPLEVVVVDFLEYCMVGEGPKTMTGSVKEERQTSIIEDGKPVTLKAIALRLQPKPDPVP